MKVFKPTVIPRRREDQTHSKASVFFLPEPLLKFIGSLLTQTELREFGFSRSNLLKSYTF